MNNESHASPLRARTEVRVCSLDELPVGERTVIDVGGRSIGVIHSTDGLYAVRNRCPHQGAPLCLGRVSGTTFADRPHAYRYDLDGRALACPWHHWEFDLRTGRSLFDPSVRVRTYPVVVRDGDIVVEV